MYLRILNASIVVVCLTLSGVTLLAQARGGTPQTDKVTPVNSGANPYRVIRDWGKIEGRAWGGSNGVAIDKDGKTVWAVDRCSPGTTPGCANTNVNPVHHFDESGKEIKSFGGGMFAWPHGIHVDRDGNIWVADSRADEATHKGSVVVKFAPDGKVLMTLGKPGVKGNPPAALTEPTVAITDPRNGATEVFQNCLERRAKWPEAQMNLALSYWKMSDYKRAQQVYEQSGYGPEDAPSPV